MHWRCVSKQLDGAHGVGSRVSHPQRGYHQPIDYIHLVYLTAFLPPLLSFIYKKKHMQYSLAPCSLPICIHAWSALTAAIPPPGYIKPLHLHILHSLTHSPCSIGHLWLTQRCFDHNDVRQNVICVLQPMVRWLSLYCAKSLTRILPSESEMWELIFLIIRLSLSPKPQSKSICCHQQRYFALDITDSTLHERNAT